MNFTCDFFSRNIPSWGKHLAHLKGTNCRVIELGSLEGRSACWLLENIIGPEGSLVCVDILKSPLIEENLRPYAGRVQLFEMDAISALTNFVPNQFDLAYIDANHVARDVIVQAGLLYPLMKPGGIMIFDDYGHKDWTVKPAVDFFLEHWDGLQVIRLGNQAIIKKL